MPREKARTAGPVKTHGYAPCGLVCLLKRLVKQSLPQQNMQKLLSEQTVQRPRGVIDFVAEKRCNIFAARKPLLPERVAVADRDACFFADIPCRLHIPVNLPIQLKRAAVRLHLPQRRAGGVARRRACAHHVRRHKDRHAARAPQCPENLPQTILVCAKSGIAAVHVIQAEAHHRDIRPVTQHVRFKPRKPFPARIAAYACVDDADTRMAAVPAQIVLQHGTQLRVIDSVRIHDALPCVIWGFIRLKAALRDTVAEKCKRQGLETDQLLRRKADDRLAVNVDGADCRPLKALDAACGEFQENEVLRVDPDLAAFDG